MKDKLKDILLKTYSKNFEENATGKEYVTLEANNANSEAEFAIYGNRLLGWMVDRLKVYDANLLYKGSALEIGCGMGRLMKPASMYFKWITGVDMSSKILDEAKEYLADIPNKSLYENNGEDLSIFNNNSFEYIYSGGVMQHIPYRDIIEKYLIEAIRILKMDGLFLFTVQVWQTELIGEGRIGAKLTVGWLENILNTLPVELLEVVSDSKDPIPHFSFLVRKSNKKTNISIKERDVIDMPWRSECWDDLPSMKQHQELQKKGQRKITFFDLN